MQSSHLFDEKTTPAWLEDANDELNLAINKLDVVHAALQEVNNSKKKDYFSNEVFQVYINKKEEFNQISAELLIAKEHIQKIYKSNQQIYVRKISEYKDWLLRLEDDKQKLLEKLVAWRRQADKKHMASRRIPLILDEKLRSKEVSELRVLCGLTEDLTLSEQAFELEKGYEQYKILYDKFIQNGCEHQCINKINFQILLDKAETLCRKYLSVSEWLTSESKAAYDAIKLDNDIIKAEILVIDARIEVALAAFRLELARADGHFNVKICHDLVNKYKEMSTVTEEARRVLHLLRDRGEAIQGKYAEAMLRFGDYPFQKAYKISKQTRKLEDHIDDAEMKIDRMDKKIKEFHRLALRGDLLNLLLNAIEKNILFWNQQVDNFWGSNAKINGVSVPTGIALMYSEIKAFDPERCSVEVILKKVARIASQRIEKGIGFFAKRTVNSTQTFYQLIKDNIEKLDCLTEEKLKDIQKDLFFIKDAKSKGLYGLKLECDSDQSRKYSASQGLRFS